jgi:hypothetical protein
MKRFPIYINYDITQPPVGFIEIDLDRVPEDILSECAIVTQTRVVENGPNELICYGLIARQSVDTRPR